jgi:metal-responsive CopG/Arc/MetJ family transcriptional regulator
MSKDTDDPIVRTSISLRQSLWREIEEYRDRERIVTTADAVRRLLIDALKAAKREAKK